MRFREQPIYAQCLHPSGSEAELTIAELEQPVTARFARMVAQYTERPAMVDLEQTLSYAQLDAASNRMARAVLRALPGGNLSNPKAAAVAILMNAGVLRLVGVYGVIKAGACHVVLHPREATERLSFVLNDLGNGLLLTDRSNLERVGALASQATILVAEEALEDESDEPVQVTILPNTPCAIRYTSGSTGRPKGVVSGHRDFLMYCRTTMQTARLCAEDRVTLFGQNYFNPVTTSLAGCTSYEFDPQTTGMDRVARLISEHALTIMGGTTTAFRQFVRSADPALDFSHLRFVYLFGEPPTSADILATKGLLPPRTVFANQYGTSESYTDAVFYADVESAARLTTLPAGYVTDAVEITLVDGQGKPVVEGEIGEIIAASRYMTLGYWNRPELTQARFHADPDGSDALIYATGDLGRMDEDGCLHYMGRKDHQVKIRGQRVEILEVEGELLAVDSVRAAAVVARPGPTGDPRLVAYIVPDNAATEAVPLTVTALREALRDRLPQAMTPSAYVFLDHLPLTASHKVDRLALPDPGKERPRLATPYVTPRTPIETQLAQIWADVLGVDEIGIDDSFLELGGDSLLASQVVTRVIRTLRVNLPLPTLLAAPTVAEMARAVMHQQVQMATAEEIEQLLAGLEMPGHA